MESHEFFELLQQDALLDHLWGHARLNRAAHALADEEYASGAHVDEAVAPDERVRLAARDHASTESVTLGAGGWRVRFFLRGRFVYAVQEAGLGGATLEVGDGWVPLEPNRAALAIGMTKLPETVVLLDLRGHRWKLE